MKSISSNHSFSKRLAVLGFAAWAYFSIAALLPAQRPAATTVRRAAAPSSAGAELFNTPQEAANALVDAAGRFDVARLTKIFGPAGADVVFSGEFAQDRKRATEFAAKAGEKMTVSVDPKTGNRASLLVGSEDWPFPLPLVKTAGKWFFDSQAGRRELLSRRVGTNELDAIAISHGYVDAQQDYAHQQRTGYDVNQYAQRIISTPGTHDGLAWKNSDGTWGGPVGENIARAIAQGYTSTTQPYHGYFFKILRGQGPAAPMGNMDYVVNGLMIGGFALAAAPAEYGVTGVRSFIVNQDGVVYEKDLGPNTLQQFQAMDRYNPDPTWTAVQETEEDSTE